MDQKKSTCEEKILEVLSDNNPPQEYEMSSEFRERLRKSVIQALHDPVDTDEENAQFEDEIELFKDDGEAFEGDTSGTDDPDDYDSRKGEQIHIVAAEGKTHLKVYAGNSPNQRQPDNEKPGIYKLKPQWKAMLSIAAVFVFLICGTVLTRGSLQQMINNPVIPGGQITGTDNPNGTGIDDLDIIDTSELKNPEGKTSGISEFFQDMWLFVKASLPYLGGAAVLILIIVMVRKRRNPNR